jgi:Glycosyl transferase family 90
MNVEKISILVQRRPTVDQNEKYDQLPFTLIFQTKEIATDIVLRRKSLRPSKNAPTSSICRFVMMLSAVVFFLNAILLISELYKINYYPSSRLLRSLHSMELRELFQEEFATKSSGSAWLSQRFVSIKEMQSNLGDGNNTSDGLSTIRNFMSQKFSDDSETQISTLEFAYSSVEEMMSRSSRFPSIGQRLKLYMSNWYIPPCDDAARIGYQYSEAPELAIGSSTPLTQLLTLREISVQARNVSTKSIIQRMGFQARKQMLYRRQRIFRVNSNFDGSHTSGSFDMVHFLDRSSLSKCLHTYCLDTVDFLLASMDKVTSKMIPILYQFGDKHEAKLPIVFSNRTVLAGTWYPKIPVIQKMRRTIRPLELQTITDDSENSCYKAGKRLVPFLEEDSNEIRGIPRLEPIVSKLKTQRHYGPIFEVAEADVVPWEEKKNIGIFRGELTGRYPANLTIEEREKLSPEERCHLLDRCWFVYTHEASQWIDAKLATPISESRMIPRYMNRTSHNSTTQIELYSDPMSMNELLQYKALIMLEGNDVSSGLKWALFSNSVVLMPEPTMTSWAMEELLIPWVHYIPITLSKDIENNDIRTDAEEKVQWIMENDEKARDIAKAGKLWIADLVLHPSVRDEETRIFDEMSRRYASHFVPLSSARSVKM